MSSVYDSQHSLRDWLVIAYSYKRRMIAVFLAVVIFGAVITLLTPPTYRASAKILVKLGREHVYSPYNASHTGSQPLQDPSREERVNSEIEILKGRGLVERVISSVGADKIYPDINQSGGMFFLPFGFYEQPTALQKATLQFQKKLKVTGVRRSNIIQVDFDHRDPVTAAQTLNSLIDTFVDQHVVAYRQPQNHSFFDSQTKTLQKNLQGSETALQAFRDRHNISAMEQQKAVLLRQISEAELGLARTGADINENRGKKASLNRGVSVPGETKYGKETDLNLHAISNIKNKIAELRVKEEEIRRRYSENSRLVHWIRKEIEKLEEMLAREEQIYHEKEVNTIDHTIDAYEQRKNRQEQDLRRYRAELSRINSLESRLKQLERQYRIDEENYQLYVKKKEEGRISEAMDTQKMANISIVQPALVPIRPEKPNKKLNLFLSIILGAFSSVGVAFLSETLNRSFRTRDDVERDLKLPVLTSLPQLKP